jgi:hypothetical protein
LYYATKRHGCQVPFAKSKRLKAKEVFVVIKALLVGKAVSCLPFGNPMSAESNVLPGGLLWYTVG